MPPNEIVDFDALYRTNCSGCHGADGNLGPRRRSTIRCFWRSFPTTSCCNLIADGRPGTPMPAFSREHGGPLTDAQVKALARESNRTGPGRSALAEACPPPSYLRRDTPTRPARRRCKLRVGRGKLFARACAECHGADGNGGDMAGAINDPAFLALISDQALRRLIITGRPDLGCRTLPATTAGPTISSP